MSERPDDHLPRFTSGEPATGGDESTQSELDSEPRRRWQPKPELLRALAATRKDLRPGEESLFWDWTATRESPPEAEDMRPSGVGEVLVSDKDAAAAYVPPKKVAPAVAPRAGTKSRIRVREDVDPRRQPTVKSPRESAPSLPGLAASFPGLAPPEAGMFGEAPRGTPAHGRAGRERRRLALALLAGIGAATCAFLWLHLPLRPGPSGEGEGRPGGAGAPATGQEPRGEEQPPIRIGVPPTPPVEVTPAPSAAADGTAAPAPSVIETARPAASRPKSVPSGVPSAPPRLEPLPAQRPATPDDDGFLIRPKKGNGSS